MKIEQIPGKPPRFPPPAAANIARAVHNLIICVLIAAQVSSSSKPPTTRVAIIRGLHTAANSGFEGAPCHNILHTASIPAPHFAAASAILCDDPPFGLTSRRHCSAGRHTPFLERRILQVEACLEAQESIPSRGRAARGPCESFQCSFSSLFLI